MNESEIILSIAKGFFALVRHIGLTRQDRKLKAAEFLTSLAVTLEEAVAILRLGQYPAGKCHELLLHSQNMVSAIGDVVGEKEAAMYAAQLKESYEIEQLHKEISGKPEQEQERSLTVLDQAAGLFRAAAAYVRVSG